MTQLETKNGLAFNFDGVIIAIESESAGLKERLRRYFPGFTTTHGAYANSVLNVIEEDASESRHDMQAWSTNGKEGFADMRSGRVIRKLRTGVTIEVHEDIATSAWTIRGPLEHNFSQLVNLIGVIYGLALLDRRGSMVHASAVCDAAGRVIAVIGQSGKGKSSVAVRLLERGFDFISNDRLIVASDPKEEGIIGHGLPKLPRVNPGTLLAGERTRAILHPDAAERYEALPKEELWRVEDKYDLEVEAVLGRRWLLSGPLACAIVLDWHHGGEGLELQRLNAGQVLEVLRREAKSFGAFDMRLGERRDGAFNEAARHVPFYRVTGSADPSRLAEELSRGLLRELD
jgi:HprK-related kinase B